MNLKDEDEYTKAFNAVTEDAPEGDSDTEASAVKMYQKKLFQKNKKFTKSSLLVNQKTLCKR